jgi:hypothetical protein
MASDQEYVPQKGDIEITLEGQTLWLKPSLEAALKISRSGRSGPRVLVDECMNLNFQTIVFVIAAGTGLKEADLEGPVFRTGTINLFGLCVSFIHTISNGGRPPSDKGDKDSGDRTGSASS